MKSFASKKLKKIFFFNKLANSNDIKLIMTTFTFTSSTVDDLYSHNSFRQHLDRCFASFCEEAKFKAYVRQAINDELFLRDIIGKLYENNTQYT